MPSQKTPEMIPISYERRAGGENLYSTLCFFEPGGSPSEEDVVGVMTSLGVQARGVLVDRVGEGNIIEIASGRIFRLTRTVQALVEKLRPLTVEGGVGRSPLIPRELIYPTY